MAGLNVSSNNVTIGNNPDYIHPLIFAVFVCCVMALGVLGNILMVITFSKEKYNTFSYSVYFRVLAVVDAIVLCLESHHALEAIMQLNTDRSDDSRLALQTYCLANSIIDDITRMISATLYFVIPFDRIIVCVMPFRFRKFAKPYTARIVCLVIIVLNLLMTLPEIVYISTQADTVRMDCKIYGGNVLRVFKAFKAFGYIFAIAFSLTLIFNIFLLVKIKSYLETRKIIRAMQSDEQKEARISAYFISVTLFSLIVSLPRIALDVARRVAETLPEDEAAKIDYIHVNAREQFIVIGMLNYSANYYILLILWKSVRDTFKSIVQCKRDV